MISMWRGQLSVQRCRVGFQQVRATTPTIKAEEKISIFSYFKHFNLKINPNIHTRKKAPKI
jgi:hypothetical protein